MACVHVQHLGCRPVQESPACRLQAPVAFKLPSEPMSDADSASVGVTIVNKQHFQTTEWLAFSWRLLADGSPLPVGGAGHEPLADGWVPLEADPDSVIKPQVPPHEQSVSPCSSTNLLHAHAALVTPACRKTCNRVRPSWSNDECRRPKNFGGDWSTRQDPLLPWRCRRCDAAHALGYARPKCADGSPA